MGTRFLSSAAHGFAVRATATSGIVALSSLAAGLPNVLEAQTREASDALRDRVEAYQTVWNTHDATAVAAFFTGDADMIMGNGPMIRGRESIQEAWQAYFAAIEPERRGTFDVHSLRLITREVALINVASETGGSDSQGRELPTRLARGTWVLVREADDWFISALRGQPAEGDVRGPPPGQAPNAESNL